MSKRFPPELLFKIRNNIPISPLIADILRHPYKRSEGIFRFLCPLCHEFNSATHSKTNLARCFTCKTNFNPIDFVMAAKKMSFPKTVYFLQTLLPK